MGADEKKLKYSKYIESIKNSFEQIQWVNWNWSKLNRIQHDTQYE